MSMADEAFNPRRFSAARSAASPNNLQTLRCLHELYTNVVTGCVYVYRRIDDDDDEPFSSLQHIQNMAFTCTQSQLLIHSLMYVSYTSISGFLMTLSYGVFIFYHTNCGKFSHMR